MSCNKDYSVRRDSSYLPRLIKELGYESTIKIKYYIYSVNFLFDN